MNARLQELTTEVLALPMDQRIRLAQRLWESIEGPWDEISGEDAQRLAIREALRRDAEMTNGALKGRTHEEVMATLRRAAER